MSTPSTTAHDPDRLPLILVIGPWGSGTTVVMQILAGLGALVPMPHQTTFDARTPNCWESVGFNQFVKSVVAEESGEVTHREAILPGLRGIRTTLRDLSRETRRPIALKYAMAAMILPELRQVFDLKLIYVSRPMSEIAATHARRGWFAFLGVEGAERVEAAMARYANTADHPIHRLHYPTLLASPQESIRALAAFVELVDNPATHHLVRTPNGRAAPRQP